MIGTGGTHGAGVGLFVVVVVGLGVVVVVGGCHIGRAKMDKKQDECCG